MNSVLENLKEIAKGDTNIPLKQFWRAIEIWNSKFHVINKRLAGTETVLSFDLEVEQLRSTLGLLKNCVNNSITSNQLIEHLLDFNIVVTECNLNHSDVKIAHVEVKRVIPKNKKLFVPTMEIVISSYENNTVSFLNLSSSANHKVASISPKFSYCIGYADDTIKLFIEDNISQEEPSCVWLKNHAFKKLVRWANQSTADGKPVENSQRLVSVQEYADLYRDLKLRYGKAMVEVWPESTDPLKFVYEDIAIAAYLLLLWKDKKQTFVDLGCGNGLLVHLLNSEGHNGVGLDVRSRRIWDLYPPTTKLKVQAITPSSENLYPTADWLIGNHSDELTPWIPVLAARSSYKCQFFLLPCCAYDFNGSKYQRVNSSLSQYSEYLDYVASICEQSGFKTERDRLRIPSTKRICFIGCGRTYSLESATDQDISLQNFIDVRLGRDLGKKCNKNSLAPEWSPDFRPRESEEKVRNCTRLGRSLLESIVMLVADQLLVKKCNFGDGQNEGKKEWNSGTPVALSDLINFIPKQSLREMKNECGGLQTILRNYHHIFKTQRGKVEFRKPVEKVKRVASWKQRPCWFFSNHPDSCPLSDSQCSFQH